MTFHILFKEKLTLSLAAADSAMVADFQTDGRLSISTFMKTPIRIDYRTQPFTVCTWLRVYHFREMPSYPLTFGSRGNIEAFHLGESPHISARMS